MPQVAFPRSGRVIVAATHYDLDLLQRFLPGRARRAHFIGAGGAGMRALAEVLRHEGWQLTGSDADRGRLGAWPDPTFTAQDPTAIHPHLDLVIHSDAVPECDVQRVRAGELGLAALSYPAVLGALMATRRGLAIAGTHGKSTTTAMLGDILTLAGLAPTVVAGVERQDGRPVGLYGSGEWLVAEACEYRGNFCALHPEIAVLLGIEPDHFDCFPSSQNLHDTFARFLGNVDTSGLVLVRHECLVTRRLAEGLNCRVESFGFSSHADWSAAVDDADRGCYRFQVRHGRQRLGQVRLRVPGRHNVANALAAIAATHHAGGDWPSAKQALEQFTGLHRRLETIRAGSKLAVLDDFAHLPTEIEASLATAREMFPNRRLWCVFQPHQVSRTAHLLDEFAASLHNADKVTVAEVYRAREPRPQPTEVGAANLAERLLRRGVPVSRAHRSEDIVTELQRELQTGDVLITLGAGDIGKIAHAISEWI